MLVSNPCMGERSMSCSSTFLFAISTQKWSMQMIWNINARARIELALSLHVSLSTPWKFDTQMEAHSYWRKFLLARTGIANYVRGNNSKQQPHGRSAYKWHKLAQHAFLSSGKLYQITVYLHLYTKFPTYMCVRHAYPSTTSITRPDCFETGAIPWAPHCFLPQRSLRAV